MKLKDLVGKDKVYNQPRAILLKDLDLKAVIKNNYYGAVSSSYKFKTNQIVIVSVQHYHTTLGTYAVELFLPGENNLLTSLTLHEDFEFDDNPSEQEEMVVALDAARLKNLRHSMKLGMTIGADPEIFAELNEQVLPAFEFLPGKDKKLIAQENAASSHPNNFYWDGYQAEFDTVPHTCLAFFTDNMRSALTSLKNVITKHNKDAKLSTKTTMMIPTERLLSDKNEHVEFGCMPSYNVYGMEGIKDDGRNVNFRSAGGHLHLGIAGWFKDRKPTHENVKPIVEALDAIVGVAAVALMGKYDNPMRRTMYGLAGEYRIPAHGLEYRVLSNSWLFHPLAMNLIWELARKAANFGHSGLMKHWKCSTEETIRIINTCDVEAARKVMLDNREIVQGLLDARFFNMPMAEFAFDCFVEGIDSVVENFTDLDTNWNLGKSWATHNGLKGRTISSAYTYIRLEKKLKKVGAA